MNYGPKVAQIKVAILKGFGAFVPKKAECYQLYVLDHFGFGGLTVIYWSTSCCKCSYVPTSNLTLLLFHGVVGWEWKVWTSTGLSLWVMCVNQWKKTKTQHQPCPTAAWVKTFAVVLFLMTYFSFLFLMSCICICLVFGTDTYSVCCPGMVIHL